MGWRGNNMSTLKAEIVKIEKIENHPNADRLDLAHVKGWQVIVGRDTYKEGDVVCYVPIDSILPPPMEAKLFPPDSKVRLHHSRVKSIKLRGAISQGMIINPKEFDLEKATVGDDVTSKLGIKKYEPTGLPQAYGNVRHRASKKQVNPFFHKYTDIENIKNYPELFSADEEVVFTEKVHGTNFRCGNVPFNADTIWKKIKKLFKMNKEQEFVYGSHNVQLQNKLIYDGYYDTNVYSRMVKQYRLDMVLQKDEVVYGEIYGDGIQKNYSYGCQPGEQKLVVFDVMVAGKYLDYDDLVKFCDARMLPVIPQLYRGKFNLEQAKLYTNGNSVLEFNQKIREGIVIKPTVESKTYIGRKILKFVSDEYLLRENSDFH